MQDTGDREGGEKRVRVRHLFNGSQPKNAADGVRPASFKRRGDKREPTENRTGGI